MGCEVGVGGGVAIGSMDRELESGVQVGVGV